MYQLKEKDKTTEKTTNWNGEWDEKREIADLQKDWGPKQQPLQDQEIKLEIPKERIDATETKLLKIKGLIVSVNTSEVIMTLKQSEAKRWKDNVL